MTVGQAIKHLEKFPPEMELFLGERTTEFGYAPLEGISKKNIPFKEDPDSEEVLCRYDVVVLEEEA